MTKRKERKKKQICRNDQKYCDDAWTQISLQKSTTFNSWRADSNKGIKKWNVREKKNSHGMAPNDKQIEEKTRMIEQPSSDLLQ